MSQSIPHDRVLIVGRASRVWEEVEQAKALTEFDQVIVINRAGCDYPGPFDHWVSFHSQLFDLWIKKRQENGYSDIENFWTAFYRGVRLGRRPRDKKGVALPPRADPVVRYVRCAGGSSGLIAVMVALQGFADLYGTPATHIVLAGVPLEVDRAHYDKSAPWREAKVYHSAWRVVLPQLQGVVKSMSGWTAELLGEPTREWLDAGTKANKEG